MEVAPEEAEPRHARAERVRRPLNGGWTLMIAAGLIAATANYALLTMEEPRTEVAVLDAPAPPGTPLDQLSLTMTSLPLGDPRAHLLADRPTLEGLAGTVTGARLEAGVLLRTSDLLRPSDTTVSAMSLPVGTTRAVGGLLQAGDRIDVIAADGDRAGYVARDIVVIDVGEPGSGLGAATGGYAVTVAVDPDQALRLAQALRDGDLDLIRTGTGG